MTKAIGAAKAFPLRLREEEYEALKIYAQATGVSMNDAAQRALRDFLSDAGRREQVDALLKQARSRFRVALDKLADA